VVPAMTAMTPVASPMMPLRAAILVLCLIPAGRWWIL
jgi:hypothetical protein